MNKREKKKLKKLIIGLIIIICASIITYISPKIENIEDNQTTKNISDVSSFDLSSIPEYTDNPYVYINNNIPNFREEEYTTKSFEKYSKLDDLGRCGVAYANICKEIMPKKDEKRESISEIKPSGWKNVKYDGIIDGKYLYNRCHLIGWQLAGENANKQNLITGTRYMNVEGMLPFEDLVDDYIEKNENNHVLYRVTPIFKEKNLVASGVQMEAYSIEDNGKGIQFNIYVYNVQPGIEINYLTGESKLKK